MDRETQNKIGFISFIIEKFASTFKLNRNYSYQYLQKYGAVDYVFNNWWALHTDNPFWVVREMYEICRKNGGYLK